MKILQMTFTYGNNLGAMMQAYALNKVLTDMGNDCYLLPSSEKPFEFPKAKFNFKNFLLKLLRNFKKRNYTDEWVSEFNHFLYNRCRFTPFIQSDQLQKIQDDYDMFLVGSDQVWNANTFDADRFLLKWVENKGKCFSYAASLGNYSIRLQNDPVAKAINAFSGVSFRENLDFEDAVRNKIDCRLDLDPTFLISNEHWESITNKKYRGFENCVVLFGYDKKSFEFAKEYAKRKHLKLVIVNYFGNRVFPGIKIVNPSCPAELLSVIKYSFCVVTHSYHVFVLSLNLNKQVFYSSSANNTKANNRFATVIDLFNLENRETDISNINSEVDWTAFNIKLGQLRENSLNYLRRITGNDK